VAVFISNELWESVSDIDTRKDQVWFSVDYFPGVNFGAVYIPPVDSPYYSEQSFADISEKSADGKDLVIIGDLNARLGILSDLDFIPNDISYSPNPDSTCNNNGRKVINLCQSLNLLPVNHAQIGNKSMDGNYTFKRQNTWISQLDWALVSRNIMKDIVCFRVLDNTLLKSDHAALAMWLERSTVLLSNISQLSADLGFYNVFCAKPSITKPVNYEHIDSRQFTANLLETGLLWNTPDLIEVATERIYTTCVASRSHNNRDNLPSIDNGSNNKWTPILQQNYSKLLWKAVNWRGSISAPPKLNHRPRICDVFQ
jgi:hypothetical protein